MRMISICLMWVVGTISPALSASGDDDVSPRQLQDWIKQGRVLPLDQIIKKHQRNGRLLDVEVEREHGRIIYEIEFLNADGRVVELEVDAASGNLLEESFDR